MPDPIYTPPVETSTEGGGLVALQRCQTCGATIMRLPFESITFATELHSRWHALMMAREEDL